MEGLTEDHRSQMTCLKAWNRIHHLLIIVFIQLSYYQEVLYRLFLEGEYYAIENKSVSVLAKGLW